MAKKVIEYGIIEITYTTGETLQHIYRSMKELKEWKEHIELKSYRIIRPLVTEEK